MSKKKRNYYLAASLVFITIGLVGTFAKKPGIYSAFYAVGVALLILALYENSKKSKS